MNLYPRNRHLVIDLIEERKEEQSAVLLPDSYKQKDSLFVQARVREISPDCNSNFSKGDRVILQRSMLQEVEVDGSNFYLVLENYIYGVLSTR